MRTNLHECTSGADRASTGCSGPHAALKVTKQGDDGMPYLQNTWRPDHPPACTSK